MQDQNVNFMPWNDTNEEEDLPTGTFHVRVIHSEDGHSGTSGKRMFRVGFNVIAPAECANLAHFENYVVGSDEQPLIFVKDTRGGRAFKKLCVKAQIPPSNEIPVLLAGLKAGAELMIAVRYNPESDFKNNITNYFRLGERDAAIATGQLAPGSKAGAGAPKMPTMPQGVMPPAIPAMPAQPVQPPAQQYAPPTAPQMPQAVTPPAIPQPVAAPQPVAPPVTQQPQYTPPVAPQPVAKAAPTAGPMMLCTICQQSVPALEFGAHVQAHAQAMQG